MSNLKRSLKEAVRKMAYSTSVEQLKKRGVKHVNVIGMDRVVSLVDQAVHRSLKHRLLAVDREEVVDATRAEFLRLLKTNEDLKRSHDELQQRQHRAESEAGGLRLELQRLQQQLEQRLSAAEEQQRARYADENAQIVDQVRLLVEQMGDGSSPGGKRLLQTRVIALVMDLVDRERRAVVAAQEAARDREVDLLQRRIVKLNQSLEITERRLLETGSADVFDSGISSIYREVQGLNRGDRNFEKKKELMAGIFEANLELQKSVRAE